VRCTHVRIELSCHKFARGKAKVEVMVVGPCVTPTADDAFKTAAVALDTKMEAASNKGRRWQYVRVGCSDAPYLDRRSRRCGPNFKSSYEHVRFVLQQ
jgi:hypothetical protein